MKQNVFLKDAFVKMKWYMNSVDDCSLPWHLLSILCKDLRATAPWHLPVGLSGVSVAALNTTGPTIAWILCNFFGKQHHKDPGSKWLDIRLGKTSRIFFRLGCVSCLLCLGSCSFACFATSWIYIWVGFPVSAQFNVWRETSAYGRDCLH